MNLRPQELLLLPQPRTIRPRDGRFELRDGTLLNVPETLAESERQALTRFCRACEAVAGRRVDLRFGSGPAEGPHIRVEVDRPSGDAASEEAYHLTIDPGRVVIAAGGGAGLFYGAQTLTQILRSAGASWPALEMTDAPEFRLRGFHLDVSRGKVPTLATLKGVVERLAHFKINQLQLYIEHTFAFAFNPRISQGCSPLTADEIRELDRFCALHHVELVPSIASYGHMARILSLPEYRRLAEIEPQTDWNNLAWKDRTRGATLDATQPESRRLLESMYAELLPLFSSGWVNVCADETFDLGSGRGAARAEQIGVGRLYLEHLHWLHELCGRYGRNLMFWGDVVRNHPHLLGEIPADAVVLHWTYARDPDCETTATFCRAGLPTVVCPSTCSWARFLSGIGTAESNIRKLARSAQEHGARGLLNTEWGDEGHANALSGSWHPIVTGAAMAWNVGQPDPGAFDRAFDSLLFGAAAGPVSEKLRALARLPDRVADWRLLRAPFVDVAAHEAVPAETADRILADARTLSSLLEALPNRTGAASDEGARLSESELVELRTAVRMSERVGEKVSLVRALVDAAFEPGAELQRRLRDFADRLEQHADEFSQAWAARNRPDELRKVLDAFATVANEARELASGRGP
jgi:hypothetical protein